MMIPTFFHGAIHRWLAADSGALMSHLVVATLLSVLLVVVSVLVRDARVRRAAALAAVLVFLVPIPDLLPERGIETFEISGLTLDTVEADVAPSPSGHAPATVMERS